MRAFREHPVAVTLLAFVVAGIGAAAIAAAWGFGAFADAWSSLHWGWLALAVCGALLSVGAYTISYRAVLSVRDGPSVQPALALRAVLAGFAPFAAGGGFALDKRVFHAVEADEESATVRVLGLGALEWALLAPAAWVSAVVLLAVGDSRPMPSLLWPWAIAVPIGFALGFWLAAPARRDRLAAKNGRWRRHLGRGLEAVGILLRLSVKFSSCWVAWLGMGLYWALDIASFYGALRFVGIHLNVGELILGYATGYALTRRSSPLAGAGATEVLMTFALHWVGQPVLPALAGVVVYRAFNLVLSTIPATLVRPRIKPLIEAAELGRTPAGPERRRARAPVTQI